MVLFESKHSKGQGQDTSSSSSSSSTSTSTSAELLVSRSSQQSSNILISVRGPPGLSKTPSQICFVVDVSGSMDSETGASTETGISESGFSQLDIVKHALYTILGTLDATDSASIVTFSNEIRLQHTESSLSDLAKDTLTKKIKQQLASGGTNIWAGLEKGLQIIQSSDKGSQNPQQIMLLTDGQSNYDPPRGLMHELLKFRNGATTQPVVNTFGFGYGVESKILVDIANETQGQFLFIPDAGLVGTVFINSIATMQSTYATNAKIILTPRSSQAKSIIPDQIFSGMRQVKQPNGVVHVLIGNIQYDQSKDIIFKQESYTELLTDYSVSLEYSHNGTTLRVETDQVQNTSDVSIAKEILRLDTVKLINQFKHQNWDPSDCEGLVNRLIAETKASPFSSDFYFQSMVNDLEGQVKIAVSKKDYIKKWGQHYLSSFAHAHIYKNCNNFKDVSVQGYAGNLFTQNRDKIESIFVNIPPPTATHALSGISPVKSMSQFFSSSAPCFSGDSSVLMADGVTMKQVKDIKKGDLIFSPHSNQREVVRCIVETPIEEEFTPLVTLGSGLKLTPWHPVRIDGKWQFPGEIASSVPTKCPAVYSFLLESGHSMMINGVECITLAHGFANSSVVTHDYFGTGKVIKDLRWMKGWLGGHVRLPANPAVRDSTGNQVIRLASNRPWMEKAYLLASPRSHNNLLSRLIRNSFKMFTQVVKK